jgi:hypothetical protein
MVWIKDRLDWIEIANASFDGLVKSWKVPFFVIPAEAGIQ